MPDDASKHSLINSLRRMLLGNARDILVSARSRIGIDEDLADFSGIEGRLLWVPGDRHVELWHPGTFDPARRPRMFGQSN